MGFGIHLKKLREQSNISAQAIADRLDVKAERLRKWEQFDRTPKQEDIIKIEEAFGLPMEKIMLLDKLPEILKSPKKDKGESASVLELSRAMVIHAEIIKSQLEHIRFLAERAPDIIDRPKKAVPSSSMRTMKLKS